MKYIFLLIVYLILFLTIACSYQAKNLPIVYTPDAPVIIPYKKYHYKTAKNINVMIDHKWHIIPKGFVTNLASIPRFLWSFYSPLYAGFVLPAIIHDYLYKYDALKSRAYADKVFLASLLNNGISYFTAFTFYIAVRVFGGFNYGK